MLQGIFDEEKTKSKKLISFNIKDKNLTRKNVATSFIFLTYKSLMKRILL